MKKDDPKLLVICGPTSTGKTSLSFKLAEKFDCEIVSADSRQVYKGMDIGTGKDVPENSKFKFVSSRLGGYFMVNNIKLWGYDLADVTEDFSVSKYAKIAKAIIQEIHGRGKLPILTGGTGLYIKSITDDIGTINIPIDKNLRNSLKEKSAAELFEILRIEDPIKAAGLNISDVKNPVRLIRAIEIAKSKILVPHDLTQKYDILFIGLTTDFGWIKNRIQQRIEKRIENGVIDEVKNINILPQSKNSVLSSVLGYKQISDYINGKYSLDEAKRLWEIEEMHYAKRQMVWFKRDNRINWFDVSDDKYTERVESLVESWHNKSN